MLEHMINTLLSLPLFGFWGLVGVRKSGLQKYFEIRVFTRDNGYLKEKRCPFSYFFIFWQKKKIKCASNGLKFF